MTPILSKINGIVTKRSAIRNNGSEGKSLSPVLNATQHGSRHMFDLIGTVSIALGSVVLDSPDQTGQFFARDLAGGWAYLVGDADGDNRFRGQGSCDGGLDTTLRCGFLSAMDRMSDCRSIRILVETREAHQMMVRLAKRDSYIVAAIAGRPISVMTRPEERSSHQVRSAAEHAARIALRDRERANGQAMDPAASADMVGAIDAEAAHAVRWATATKSVWAGEALALRNWRARRGVKNQSSGIFRGPEDGPRQAAPTLPEQDTAVRGFIRPFIERTRKRLIAVGMLAPTVPQRRGAVKAWLLDFDRSVAAVTSDLQDAGA
jgi:hypothetical protein